VVRTSDLKISPFGIFGDWFALDWQRPAHASIHNHFNHGRHFSRRTLLEAKRSAVLAEWFELVA